MTRLEAICSLIHDCGILVDVGCDHGLIARRVLDSGRARKVIATDISEKCLQKARILLADYNNVEFACTDGLTGIKADTAVIAGMGGNTIMDILKSAALSKETAGEVTDTTVAKETAGEGTDTTVAKESAGEGTDATVAKETAGEGTDATGERAASRLPDALILQPQDFKRELRQYLLGNSYDITSDFIVKEKGKYYDIIRAERRQGGQAREADELQLELGMFYNQKEQGESYELLKERMAKDLEKLTSYQDAGKNDNKRNLLRKALEQLQ